MIASIVGSETEFGLVPRTRDADAAVRSYLFERDYRWREQAAGVRLEKIFGDANWWKEKLETEEETKAGKADLPDRARRLGLSGEYLPNGGRFYLDGHHPEYSTPECADPFELVLHELAGEKIMRAAADGVEKSSGAKADVLKRNADYRKASYACHANYFLSRGLFQKIATRQFPRRYELPLWTSCEQAIWASHLITMQIMSGAGRILPDLPWPDCLILSQRQLFVECISGLDTTVERGIINTRDRPYADPWKFARLHVICCDSNRCAWSNVLKYGTSRLVLSMLEDFAAVKRRIGARDLSYLTPANPVADFRSLRDKDSQVATAAGTATALGLQRLLLLIVGEWHAERNCAGYSWVPRLLGMWRSTLDMLENDDERLYSLLDFFVKKRLFENSSKTSRALQSLEYNYHLVGPESLYDRLVLDGRVETVFGEDEIKRAETTPPKTRARLRSRIIRLTENKPFVSWHVVGVESRKRAVKISMPDPSSEEHYIRNMDDIPASSRWRDES